MRCDSNTYADANRNTYRYCDGHNDSYTYADANRNTYRYCDGDTYWHSCWLSVYLYEWHRSDCSWRHRYG